MQNMHRYQQQDRTHNQDFQAYTQPIQEGLYLQGSMQKDMDILNLFLKNDLSSIFLFKSNAPLISKNKGTPNLPI